ncbi:MAG: permease-like cell division protein FtsX [Paludibacteraceae bacterium]|nr:permease-like cell division protein FtsX [Paludibacteraceae bacterium]MBR6520058.1 permease-like cell division protein FtsX [Paludibacteraceae bacterium]
MSEQNPKKYKESFFNLHFTSTISISLVLFMIGLIVSLYLTTHYFTVKSKENISLSIILNDTISETDLSRLERYLNATEYTKQVVYISRDSALKEHIAAIGEDPSEFLGYNPLNASLEVFLTSEYASTDSINNVILPRLQIFNGITNITYQKEMIELLNNNINKLSLILSLIALVMLFISIVLINNTIRLSIYSKRFIINTMQLVGAKNSFIRRPFLNRSLINSFIATLLSLLLLGGSIYLVQIQIGTAVNLYHAEIVVPVVVIIFFISIIINCVATVAAVNRYLRMRTEQLYFI